jgi:hypothetical protein
VTTGRWQWVGIAFMDDEGSVVAWEVKRPDCRIEFQRSFDRSGRQTQHLRLDAAGAISQWDGHMPSRPHMIEASED